MALCERRLATSDPVNHFSAGLYSEIIKFETVHGDSYLTQLAILINVTPKMWIVNLFDDGVGSAVSMFRAHIHTPLSATDPIRTVPLMAVSAKCMMLTADSDQA